MDIKLTWDLFVIVFFIIIVAYSFIIGRDNTLKVILGTYVAALAADAAGSLFNHYMGGSKIFLNILSLASVSNDDEAVILVKVVVFVSLVILFAVKGAFSVRTVDDRSIIIRMILLFLYALMSASLIISIILIFISGVSLIGGDNGHSITIALRDLYTQSQLIRLILGNAYILFFVPALSFLIHSFYSKE